MTTPEPAPADGNPMLGAEEIGKRFLKLLEGLESREDLSLERIRDVMGITLTLEPGALSAGVANNELGGGWGYVFFYIPGLTPSRRGVGLTFEHDVNRFSDMSAVCELDFDFYHNALKSMQYRDVPIYGEIGELRSWRYYKNDIVISIIPQNVIAGEAGRVCVKSIGTLN